MTAEEQLQKEIKIILNRIPYVFKKLIDTTKLANSMTCAIENYVTNRLDDKDLITLFDPERHL